MSKDLKVVGLVALEDKDRKLLTDVLAALTGKGKTKPAKAAEEEEPSEAEEGSEAPEDNGGDPFGDDDAGDGDAEHTIEDVRNALRAYSKKKSQKEAVTLMNKTGGAKTVDAIKPEKYGAIIEAVKKAGVKLG